MCEAVLWPRLEKIVPGILVRRVLKATGLGESEAEDRIRDLYPDQRDLNLTILASPGQIELHVSARSDSDPAARRAARPGTWVLREAPDGSHFAPTEAVAAADESGVVVYRFGRRCISPTPTSSNGRKSPRQSFRMRPSCWRRRRGSDSHEEAPRKAYGHARADIVPTMLAVRTKWWTRSPTDRFRMVVGISKELS